MDTEDPIEAYRLRQALKETADCFRQFARNGRWGTCAACPRDREGAAYPEFCAFTGRSDHLHDIHELARTYKTHHDRAFIPDHIRRDAETTKQT